MENEMLDLLIGRSGDHSHHIMRMNRRALPLRDLEPDGMLDTGVTSRCAESVRVYQCLAEESVV